MRSSPPPAAEPVHLCDYADQPDIRIACTETWTTPKWAGPEKRTDLPADVHQGDNDQLYTFEPELVTCVACKAWKPAGTAA